jgi:hypothetical protein
VGDADNLIFWRITPLLLFPGCEKLCPQMRRPPIGEFNLGALAAAVVGSIGGLFAVGLPPAILARNPALLFGTPILGLICWLVSGLAGWFLGGQIGPRLGEKFESQQAEVLGGALAGLIPVTGIALWSWYMVTQ